MAKFTHTDIEIIYLNHGTWTIKTMAWGKPASCITHDSELVDLYNSKSRGWKTAKMQLRNKVIQNIKKTNGK